MEVHHHAHTSADIHRGSSKKKWTHYFWKCLMLFLAVLPVGLKAQYPQLVFKDLNIQNGLPNAYIFDMLQDKQGYIWMGTQAGIVRYDGYRTKVYDFGNENTLYAATYTFFEDKDGKLWVGTENNGLLYYDRGSDNFVPYEPAIGNKLSNNTISQILEGVKQELWVISMNQKNQWFYLDKISLKTGIISHYSFFEKGNHHIDATILGNMILTKNGKLWMGTNNGFYEYDPVKDSFTGHNTSKDHTAQKRYYSLLEDPLTAGVLWMGQSGDAKVLANVYEVNFKAESHYIRNEGLLQYNSINNTAIHYRKSENNSSIGNDSVYSIKTDLLNNLWVATPHGLSLYDRDKKCFKNYTFPVRNNTPPPIEAIIQPDDKGNVWYLSNGSLFNNGLQYFDASSQSFTYSKSDKLPFQLNSSGRVTCMLLDREKSIWIGIRDWGANWINKKASRFKIIKKDINNHSGYPGGDVLSFAELKDHSFWIANLNGLYNWFPKNDSFVLKNIDPSNNKVGVLDVFLDSKGWIWCGTNNNGLYIHEPITKKTIHYISDSTKTNTLSGNGVIAIFEDSKGRIWIGTTRDGLCLWQPKTNDFKRYPYVKKTGSLSNYWALDNPGIHVIYEDVKGTIWVGTHKSLHRLDETTDRFISYYNQPPGLEDIATALSFDSGNFYVGTFFTGLYLFDSKTNKVKKKLTEKDGLLFNGAWKLLEDNDHNIWVISRRGISIIDSKTKQIRNISRLNGFPETNILAVGTKSSDGKFMIGCQDGILVFDPAHFKPDTISPLLHIEQLSFSNPLNKKKDGDSVVILFGKKEIRLSYNQNKVSFYYTALSYQDAALNKYSVWLEGFEKNWVDKGTQRVVTYNNLGPGTYTFHVKAANSDGVWSKTDETFVIIISPPWWRTWWAYLLYALVFVLAIWAYNRYRIAGLKREKEVLENKVTDRTKDLKTIQDRLEMQSLRSQLNPHFMFNSLNAIQELILMEENDKSHSYLARFSKLLRLLLENTEKPFIPLQREIDFIQLYLSLENLRIPKLQYSITVDPAIDTEHTAIPNMILQPYIENAIWHGLSHKLTDKKLQIRITKTNGAIQYEIEDNGVGRKRSTELKSLFRKEHKSKGMELLSKRFRLLSKELGADIVTNYEDVMSNGDVAGTLVTIKVPNHFSEENKNQTS